MDKKRRKEKARKIIAFAMALMVSVSFLPLLGEPSYAADNQEAAKATTEAKAGANKSLAEKVAKYQEEFEQEEVTDLPDIDLGELSEEELEQQMRDNEEENAKAPSAEAFQDIPDAAELVEKMNSEGTASELLGALDSNGTDVAAALKPEKTEPSGERNSTKGTSENTNVLYSDEPMVTMDAQDNIIKISNNKSSGIAKVSGQLSGGEVFTYMYINGTEVLGPTDSGMGGSTLSQTLYMYNLPVGVYAITVYTSNGRYETEGAITYVYRKPANSISKYEVYHNYFMYNTPKKDYTYDGTCGVFLDYKRTSKKKWKHSGLMSTYSEYKIPKLKSKTKYKARAYYGKIVEINGEKYKISGANNSKYSKTVVFKTGPSKLNFKSVRVKLTHVRKHTQKKYGSLGVYHGKVIWYTCKLRATVKLKKAPGARGIFINSKRCKGNKKTYTANLGKASTLNMTFCKYKAKTYTWYKSDEYFNLPKGKKFKLLIYSYNSKKYGGYSKAYVKKAKMR